MEKRGTFYNHAAEKKRQANANARSSSGKINA
jgi:hypothetical protein